MTAGGPLGRATGVLVVAVLAGSGCAGAGVAEIPPEKVAVDATINQVIVPGVERVAESAWRLTDEIESWCDDPSPAAAQAASERWTDVVEAWSATTTHGIGPAVERDSDDRIGRAFSVLAGLEAAVATDGGSARCPQLLEAAREVAEETAALERAWNAGPDGGLPFRSTAAGIGDGSLDNDETIAAIRELQVDAIEADLERAADAGEMSADELARWRIEASARLGGIRDGVAYLGDLAAPAAARRQRAAVEAAIDAFAVTPADAGPDWAAVQAALEELRDAVRGAAPRTDR